MTWFAKRPLAQSRAAVLCSLLPWPDDEQEQKRVQAIIREALGSCQDLEYVEGGNKPHGFGIVDCARYDVNKGYDAARSDVIRLLEAAYPDRPAEMLDPFSGRGLIPVEAARYGQQAYAIDYSPVAALASRLLIDWPFRDWSAEPQLPFEQPGQQVRQFNPDDPLRLVYDIETVQAEVQRRWAKLMDPYYPDNDRGEKPWGYLWAAAIPCNGCGRWFPLYGSNTLREPDATKDDQGQSVEISTAGSDWSVLVVQGQTQQEPTMHHRGGSKKGKLAWCPFADCGHAHELAEHKRLVEQNYERVVMLVVADLHGNKKVFRPPDEGNREAAERAAVDLAELQPIDGLSARPQESIAKNDHDTIRAAGFGAATFGDLSVDRQNLAHAQLAGTITSIADDLLAAGFSSEYVRALTGYCGSAFTRKLRRSTRGVSIAASRGGVSDVFINESSVGFNYDFFEVGIGKGPGSWGSVAGPSSAVKLLCGTDGRPAEVQRGSALSLPIQDGMLDAVVTDPPYDMMIEYTDASDLFYVWLRRALGRHHFDFAVTTNPRGVQEKDQELIVKKMHAFVGDHRTPEFYDTKIAEAFAECRRVVHDNGVVSIVFGHGDTDVWKRLLTAIHKAGLILTGAWPANTEKGGAAGSSNINTTLTLACRSAPPNRPDGRVAKVDAEMREVIADRIKSVWGPSGLSYVDQKMAAAGPALEVVGRYDRILDKAGKPVDLTRYLPLARRAVTELHDLRFDSLPLGTFDAPTQFALEWARSYGRQVQAASEARWQRLAADLEERETDSVLKVVPKGVRLITSSEADVDVVEGSPLFTVALAAAAGWRSGSLADAAAVIREAGIDPAAEHFWASINALSKALPETDDDGQIWVRMVRNRDAVVAAVSNVGAAAAAARQAEEQQTAIDRANPQLFEDPNSLFGQEGN